jgi:hypothetical protein
LTSLKALIIEVLESREMQVHEKDGYLIGRKGEVEVAFCLIGAGEEGILPAFLDRFADFRGKKVVVSLGPIPELPRDRVDSQVVFWDREAVEHEIGRTRIEKLVGDRDHGLVDELVADDYPRMVTKAELDRMQVEEVGERIIRPTIDVHDVKEIGMRTVGGFRHRLELIPHYLFDYSCDLMLAGKPVGTEKGRVSVNALTKKAESWSGSLDIVYALEQGHRRLDPTIVPEAAEEIARDEVVRLHTAEREFVDDQEHVTVKERKKVAPIREEIRLTPLGLYYLPVWCVEGVHGVMLINAGTGKIVSEDYYRL